MNQDRNTGVTEARFALTLIICVLVAVGYVAVHRLSGGPSQSTIVVRPIDAEQPTTPPADENVPRVLPVDVPSSSGSTPSGIATLPDRTPGDELKTGHDGPASPSETQRR
jgi:hypothetical protein